MAKAKGVKITVLGEGLSYKGEVSVSVAGQIIAWCLSESASASQGMHGAPVMAASAPSRANDPNESVSEYFNRHAPKRNPDKILTLASFLKDLCGQASFTAKDIKALFRDVGEIPPANFQRDFDWASKKNGWIAKEAGTKDSYRVTSSGAKALEAGFSKDVLDKTKITSRGRGRGKKPKK